MATRITSLTTQLTREEFRAIARAKGWQYKMLAERWGVTPEWISHVSRDPTRDLRFDDALFGLPNLRQLPRDMRQRTRQIGEALTRSGTGEGLSNRSRAHPAPATAVTCYQARSSPSLPNLNAKLQDSPVGGFCGFFLNSC